MDSALSLSRRTFCLGLPGAALTARSLTTTRALVRRPHSTNEPVGFDPWLEVDAAALRHNAREIHRLAGERPILAVIKNNAYGLGQEGVARILDQAPEIAGFAVVKAEEAIALRQVGIAKPILLMGLFGLEDGVELASRGIRLAPFAPDAAVLLGQIARRLRAPVPIHLYVDTGMNRLGIPYHRAVPWMTDLTTSHAVTVEGTFTTFTEDREYDLEQLARFRQVTAAARRMGASLGRLHAASSHGLFFTRDAYLDMVRPGLTLYGGYPNGAAETGLAALRVALRLKARVVRAEQVRPGDSVSYDRAYIATEPTWVATLPVGHADGYPRSAVNGCEVLIGDRLYPPIGEVSASHTIVRLGPEKTADVGDVATLVGPDRPEITPNVVAQRAGVSVYDILMHASALLARRTG